MIVPTEGLPPWAQVTSERQAHIERVVGLLDHWARALGVPPDEASRWRQAGWLHDALKDAPSETIRPADDPEFADASPSLWHGPASARRAAADGEDDRGVLDAVRYHTVGHAEWDDAGRLLFLADYLEPGRALDAAWRRFQVTRVEGGGAGVDEAVRDVLAARVERHRASRRPLHERTVAWARALGL